VNAYVLSFLVSTGYVAAKSWQQLNVSHKIYWLIPPVSIIMAFAEIYVVHTISKNGLDDMLYVALSLGLGGGFGSVAATYLHSKILTNELRRKYERMD
jgi:hypothetical protein